MAPSTESNGIAFVYATAPLVSVSPPIGSAAKYAAIWFCTRPAAMGACAAGT